MTTRDPNTVTDIAQARRKAFEANQDAVADMLLHGTPLSEIKAIQFYEDNSPIELAFRDELARRRAAPRIGGWKFWTVQIVGWAALAAGLWWAVRS